jgi:hypothetical protein
MILQQLFREGDARFERVELTFKAWRGDAEAIAGHIGENDQRGEMSFWDRAAGIMDVKAALEAQIGSTTLPAPDGAELKRLGLPVALANLSLMKFALERLAPLGQRLTGLDVKRIQPRHEPAEATGGLWEMDEAWSRTASSTRSCMSTSSPWGRTPEPRRSASCGVGRPHWPRIWASRTNG